MRESERGCCLLVVTAACGEGEEDKRSLPLCFFFDVVYLSHSTFYNLWAVVVFPTIVGFPRYILCLHIISVFCVVFVHTFSVFGCGRTHWRANLNRCKGRRACKLIRVNMVEIRVFSGEEAVGGGKDVCREEASSLFVVRWLAN